MNKTRNAEELAAALRETGGSLVLAESCTAGLIAAKIACVPGASKVLWGAYICYTVEAKSAMLGIAPALIEKKGAVSEEVAREMARGALENRLTAPTKARRVFAASVTGLAGPDGDDRGTPLGTVWIGTALWEGGGIELEARRFLFEGGRQDIREKAADMAIELLLSKAANSLKQNNEDRH